MKLNQIALAVTAALVAGQAAALTPAQVGAARTAGTLKEVWISGNSAPAHNRYLAIRKECDAGTVHTYTSGSSGNPGSAGNYEAYACNIGGVPYAIYDQFAGGSFSAFITAMGVPAPAGVSLPLHRINNLDTAAGCALGASTPEGDPRYYSCAQSVPATGVTKPDGGFSDVESALFKSLLEGKTSSSFGTESGTLIGQVFGVAVTVPLYRAMQAAQGLNTVACTDGGNDDFEGACVPNITTPQYTSIVAKGGGYNGNWGNIVPGDTTHVMYLERRVDSSGTQATSNANFLRYPCNGDPGAGGALTPADPADNSTMFQVTLNSGTGDVKSRMTSETNAGQYGIGVMSLENNWRTDSAASAGYRFIKLDGSSPEDGDLVDGRLTTDQGKYQLASEMAEFTSNDGTANPNHAAAVALIDKIAADLGAPAACADVGRGMFVNPQAGSSLGTSCVALGTRFGANCQPWQLF